MLLQNNMNTAQQILSNKDASILLIEERERKDILIGAPHHAIGGKKDLPCVEHPDADENSGLIAHQIATTLNLSSIIACNYRVDPNKNLRTDYALQIAQWTPKYLIEIHGHGAKSASENLIEISSGSAARNDFSKKFADTLQSKLLKNDSLKKYVVSGDFSKLHFKGTKSATIIDERWIPLQIELPPSIRLDNENKLPEFCSDFINFLIETINEVCV